MVLKMYDGAGFAFDGFACVFQRGNDRLTTGFCEGDRCLDFRQHGAGGKMPFAAVLLGFLDAHFTEALLIRLAPVDADAVNGGQNDERVGMYQLGKLRGGEVLVDDCGRAVELAVSAHDGNAAAADRDDHAAVLDPRSRCSSQ